ncbi:hypothetical protein TS85_22285 [Sphingomonas hengshuiensis]|uniref:Nuclease n=1 Tax=Sphingomonas hengshuiensis TaxID=1609977 RepID=A0A7U4LGU8_9SPHN|nr:hypothetical protein TS85_22285 [Sphingomonas hengshuiensis]
MALLTALICSLVPLGPAHARTIGSAFDPTTTLVVVSPRGPHVRKGERSALRAPSPEDSRYHRFEPATRIVSPLLTVRATPDTATGCPVGHVADDEVPLVACRAGTIGARAPPRG